MTLLANQFIAWSICEIWYSLPQTSSVNLLQKLVLPSGVVIYVVSLIARPLLLNLAHLVCSTLIAAIVEVVMIGTLAVNSTSAVLVVELPLQGTSFTVSISIIVSTLVLIVVLQIVIWIGGIRAVFAFKGLLLHEHAIKLNIAVVHDQVFRHKAFKCISIDDVECTMLSKAPH